MCIWVDQECMYFRADFVGKGEPSKQSGTLQLRTRGMMAFSNGGSDVELVLVMLKPL